MNYKTLKTCSANLQEVFVYIRQLFSLLQNAFSNFPFDSHFEIYVLSIYSVVACVYDMQRNSSWSLRNILITIIMSIPVTMPKILSSITQLFASLYAKLLYHFCLDNFPKCLSKLNRCFANVEFWRFGISMFFGEQKQQSIFFLKNQIVKYSYRVVWRVRLSW